MAENRVKDAWEEARAAIDAYDSLDRGELRDAGTLKEHAVQIHSALDRLVDAVVAAAAEMPDAVNERSEAARDALDELGEATELEKPQHVRRACYLLRRETVSLLEELEEVAA